MNITVRSGLFRLVRGVREGGNLSLSSEIFFFFFFLTYCKDVCISCLVQSEILPPPRLCHSVCKP